MVSGVKCIIMAIDGVWEMLFSSLISHPHKVLIHEVQPVSNVE